MEHSADVSPKLKYWQDLRDAFEYQLERTQKDESNLLRFIQHALVFASESLQKVTASIQEYAFLPGEEVYFFKVIKPYFAGRLIYYSRLSNLEVERSMVSMNAIEEFYTVELKRIKGVFDQHRFIYGYLRSGATHLDDRLFFQARPDMATALYGFEPSPDSAHPICYDHVVAQILAAELLQKFLQEAIDNLRIETNSTGILTPRVTWTDSKTGLIELAYALQSAGVLNNGKIDLKDVIDFLEKIFHVNLGNYPRTFQEILSRKTGYTNFIDRLKNKLLMRIQHIEDKYDRG